MFETPFIEADDLHILCEQQFKAVLAKKDLPVRNPSSDEVTKVSSFHQQ
jgi:hypothetical protein